MTPAKWPRCTTTTAMEWPRYGRSSAATREPSSLTDLISAPRLRRGAFFSPFGPLRAKLTLYALVELRDIYNPPFMRTVADKILFVPRFNFEKYRASFGFQNFRGRADTHSHGGGRDMAHIEHGTQALETRR